MKMMPRKRQVLGIRNDLSGDEKCHLIVKLFNNALIVSHLTWCRGDKTMKSKTVIMLIAAFFVLTIHDVQAEELYVITVSDGSEIVVKNYRFTDEFVEYTTKSGLPGFMKKEDFVAISNMIGVKPEESVNSQSAEELKKREIIIWIISGLVLLILYIIFMVYVTRRKKTEGAGAIDIHYGRIEKDPVTQGLLSFEYKELLGKKQMRTIEVFSAYEEEGILYINGYCTVKHERKLFRADRVIGLAKDMSSDHSAPIEQFFVDAEE